MFYNCAMAAMYESIILCVIGIVVYTSAAYNINRNICLETAVRFIYNQYRCQLRIADTVLNDEETCTNKCNVQIYYWNNRYTYYLYQVYVTIGAEQAFTQSICQPSHMTYEPMYMNIKCLSWNKDKYRVNVMNPTGCRLRNAQCEKIGNYCICHCYSEHLMVNGSCLKENVTVGQYCSYQWQCTGTEYASVCNHGRCECQSGYILIWNTCYQGNVSVGGLCHHSKQCAGTEHSRTCKNSRCTCSNEYILIDLKCEQDNVPVGGFCNVDKQCTGSNNSETCKDGRCRCSDGHILLYLECIQGNLSLNQSCIVNAQCSSSNYSRCVDEKCTCMEGYTAENLTNCIKSQPNEFGSSGRNQQDYNIGSMLGTLFGGILIGVILTAVIAFLMFQKIGTEIKKREEPIVMFANDAIYSSANVVEHEDITGLQKNDKKRKVVNVSPYTCSARGAVYNFVTRKPRIEQPTKEGVYNHLHEQEKHGNDDDDNYDHACAASYHGTEPSVYSNMP